MEKNTAQTDAWIEVEVACALPDRQSLRKLKVPADTSALAAVEQSRILDDFPEYSRDNLKLGIFSKAITPETILRAGDRVELYRPLIADPKAVRRARAAEGKAMKKGGGDAA